MKKKEQLGCFFSYKVVYLFSNWVRCNFFILSGHHIANKQLKGSKRTIKRKFQFSSVGCLAPDNRSMPLQIEWVEPHHLTNISWLSPRNLNQNNLSKRRKKTIVCLFYLTTVNKNLSGRKNNFNYFKRLPSYIWFGFFHLSNYAVPI